MTGIEPALVQLFVVGLCLGVSRRNCRRMPLLASLLAVVDQLRRVLRLFDVLVAVEGTQMLGDELVALEQPQPIGVEFERE